MQPLGIHGDLVEAGSVPVRQVAAVAAVKEDITNVASKLRACLAAVKKSPARAPRQSLVANRSRLTVWVRFLIGLFVAGIAVASQSENVRVLVADSSSGLPIPGTVVAIVRDGERPASLETDSEGGIAFSGLRHGDYSLRAEKAGYVDLLDLDGQGRRLTVAASGLRVEIRLCRAASISGVVRDWDGHPVQGAMVFAMVRRDAGDASRLARYGEARRTDELGRYRLFGLPPGHYSVGVLPRRRNTMEETLAPGFYYGSADPSAAVFFKLSAGDIRTSVDLTAPLATNASITGTVSGISNDPGPTRAAIALVARGGLQPLIAAVLTEENAPQA